jgi:hypothetical protein
LSKPHDLIPSNWRDATINSTQRVVFLCARSAWQPGLESRL